MARRSARDAETFALLAADVFDAADALRRHGERIAAAEGQTQARWQLLNIVSSGDWTVPLAADRLGVSRQAVQRIANDVVAAGLAAFHRNPRHRRSPFMRLTDTGVHVLDVITRRSRASHEALLPELESLDLVELRAELRHLTTVVRFALAAEGPNGD